MNSTELIALAERRFEELGGAERVGEWRSWYRGFLEGFVSRAPVSDDELASRVRVLEETLRWTKHHIDMITDAVRAAMEQEGEEKR